MKQFFVFTLLALFGAGARSASAQTKYSLPPDDFIAFHKNMSDGERMLKHDSALQAYARFDIGFSEYKGAIHPSHYYSAALAALKIKEEFKSMQYLQKALLGGYELDSAQRAKFVYYSPNAKKEYAANIGKWVEEGRASKNTNYENSVYALQEVTKKYSAPSYTTAIAYCAACLKNKSCSKTAPEFTSKMRLVKEKMKADSANAADLLGYIKEYGFPDYKLMDAKACAIARATLLNYDADRDNARLDPILYNALLKGQISPSFYAQVIDQRNLFNGYPQEFYEPLAGNEKALKTEAAKANVNRKKLGLYPVEILPAAATKGVDLKNMKALERLYTKIYEY